MIYFFYNTHPRARSARAWVAVYNLSTLGLHPAQCNCARGVKGGHSITLHICILTLLNSIYLALYYSIYIRIVFVMFSVNYIKSSPTISIVTLYTLDTPKVLWSSSRRLLEPPRRSPEPPKSPLKPPRRPPEPPKIPLKPPINPPKPPKTL